MASARDLELHRIASNNPAMTISTPYRVTTETQVMSRTTSTSTSTATGSSAQQPQHHRRQQQQQQQQQQQARRSEIVTDPAGDMIETAPSNETDDESSAVTTTNLSKYDKGWRRVVRNFSPSWFSATMGTGIVSLLFAGIPWHAAWLYWFSVIFFCLNVVIFVLAFGISVVRYTAYPEIWGVMINDPTNSLFLGTAAMGFATLIESWITLCCPYWGNWSVTLAWVLWMVDSVVSFAVTVSLSFLLISATHQQSLERITAAQLLPISTTIVASSAGVRVAEVLNRFDHGYALATTITSFIMWGMSVPFAMTVLVMYYQRLALHKLPPREIIVSSFLPLGPLGLGGYSIMYMGKVFRDVLPHVEFLSHIPMAGDILYILGMFVALVMWGFGVVWLTFALATISKSPSFPFNMGWWGFTFPLGVFAVATIQFGIEMPSLFFRVLGTIFAVMVMMLWVVVAAGTVRGICSGKLFYAPCLKNLPAPRTSDTEKGLGVS